MMKRTSRCERQHNPYVYGVMLQYKVPSAHNKGNILESWVEVYCVQAFDTKIDKENREFEVR